LEELEYIYDDQKEEEKRKKREELLKKRRQEALKKQKIKNRIILSFIGIAGLLLLILLIRLVAAFVKKNDISDEGLGNNTLQNVLTNEVNEATAENADITNKDDTDINTDDPDSKGKGETASDNSNTDTLDTESNDSGSYLGYNKTLKSDQVKIKGRINVYSGYQTDRSGEKELVYSDDADHSKYGILIDASTGKVICQMEGFTRINPASMTKIMTVLVAAEHLKEEDLDKEITITSEDNYYSYKNGLSNVGYDIDEKTTVRDLFYGTILPSGADAAIALARYVAGDEASFVDLMNEKVKELGLKDTHFTNCVGLYSEDHYSSCMDMAMILKATVENDFCYEVMNAHRYTVTPTEQHPEGIDISNWFLRRIEDKDTGGEVLCAKTGYVNEAGSCAASFALSDDGRPYICVTCWAHSAWRCIYDQVDIYYNYT